MCLVRIRLLSEVAGRDQFAGRVMALAVDPTGWELSGVLIEPARRIGLGKWVPPGLIRSGSREALRLQLGEAQFAELEDAESSTLEEGVRSMYVLPFPYVRPAPDLVRRVVTHKTPPGTAVLSSSTPVVGLDWDKVTFGGVVTGDQDRIQYLIVLRQRFIGQSEVEVPANKSSLTDRGIRVDQ